MKEENPDGIIYIVKQKKGKWQHYTKVKIMASLYKWCYFGAYGLKVSKTFYCVMFKTNKEATTTLSCSYFS